MKAMILAAGLGTRLRPLTDSRPKALVEIGGRTLLEITLARLRSFDIHEVIINVHHFADMIVEYLKIHDNFGMGIEISREETLLDTGGGVKKAAYFLASSDPSQCFILHNVDVLSTIDLRRMTDFHLRQDALSTLAVQDRKTSRHLLFDREFALCGRRIAGEPQDELVRGTPCLLARAFAGIHVISPRIFEMMPEEGTFSIIPTYLRLAGKGERILGFSADEYEWRDLGTPGNLRQADGESR